MIPQSSFGSVNHKHYPSLSNISDESDTVSNLAIPQAEAEKTSTMTGLFISTLIDLTPDFPTILKIAGGSMALITVLWAKMTAEDVCPAPGFESVERQALPIIVLFGLAVYALGDHIKSVERYDRWKRDFIRN